MMSAIKGHCRFHFYVSPFRRQTGARIVGIVLLVLGVCGAAGSAPGLAGHWQPESDTDAIITIRRSHGLLQGHVSDHRSKPAKATGLHTLRDFKFDAEQNRWIGQVYSAKRDKLLNGTIRQTGENAFELTVRFGFIRRTVLWRRMPGPQFSSANPSHAHQR